MSTLPTTTQGLAADPGALNALRYGAGRDGQGGKTALKEAAKQFESLFMRELIKSMRDATQKSGLLEGQGSDLGTDLLDQQLAVQLSGLPGGLSSAIERQLGRQMKANGDDGAAVDGATDAAGAQSFKPLDRSSLKALMRYAPSATPSAAAGAAATSPSQRQAGFVSRHSDAAEAVARESGIPAGYMIGQAGHETGWGKSEIRNADGSPSYNLFGIKATPAWKGKVAEVTTTEYVNGVPRKTTARFRAYDSYADSFRDYARLITRSPRYDKAMDQIGSVHGFATSLQRAGYATDPQYAAKLSRAINTTLNLQRAQS
ncbi:flagellar assembly peptidoglycan hydrolase FlgJ [Hydrogenophaga sp.]|uniref:flagellar assembly peptidoglycan hydrolase FlgJ n=1 Tax=Hydrogenophaga sp. TaxID=1904254 RepID=UPI0035B2C83F